METTSVKIVKISVKKLFGVFDHDVPIGEGGITLVLGENGLGKTVLLEIVDAFFNNNHFYFNRLKFESIEFMFSDAVAWKLRKEEGEDGSRLLLTQVANGSITEPVSLFAAESLEMRRLANRIARDMPNIVRLGAARWADRFTGRILSAQEVLSRYNWEAQGGASLRAATQGLLFEEGEMPDWYTARTAAITVTLIETQRLLSRSEEDDKVHKMMVPNYAQQLSVQLKTLLTESTELSSKLDRTFPNRLLKSIANPKYISDDTLSSSLDRLEKKRELLDEVGLIEIEKNAPILEASDNQETTVKNVLMLHVEDSFKKIEIFDDIAAKVSLFLSIINKRFKHKRLFVDREKGFFLRSTILFESDGDVGEIVPLEKLSSGEQNELALFYLLLFKSKPHSLILIDEPELSLHISWQNNFVDDLRDIRQLIPMDVVIATHSPDIIGENWHLKVELKGLE